MIRTLQTNLTGGAISVDARDRLDLAVWKNSVAEAENVRIHPQGGASRRPGLALRRQRTRATTGTSTTSYQIEPFIFSADQQYVFVFTSGIVNGLLQGQPDRPASTLPGFWTEAMIANNELSVVQSFDTMLVFHKDVETVSYVAAIRAAPSTPAACTVSYFNDGDGNLPRHPFHKYAAAARRDVDRRAVELDRPSATSTCRPPTRCSRPATSRHWFNLRGHYLYIVGVINPFFALAVMTIEHPRLADPFDGMAGAGLQPGARLRPLRRAPRAAPVDRRRARLRPTRSGHRRPTTRSTSISASAPTPTPSSTPPTPTGSPRSAAW